MRLPDAKEILSKIKVTAILGAPVIASLVGLAWYKINVFDFDRAESELEQAYRQAKQVGYPLTASDITSPPHYGASPDPLDEQFVQIMTQCDTKRKSLFPNRKFPSQRLLRLREYAPIFSSDVLREFELTTPFIDEASQVAMQQGERFGKSKDWDLNYDVLLPEFAPHKTLIKLLGARAILRASRADVDTAIKDLSLGITLSRYLKTHPTLIGHLVMIAEHAILARAATKCIELQPSQASKFAKLVEIAAPFDIRYALRGEAYMHLALLRNLVPEPALSDAKAPDRRRRILRNGFPTDKKSRAFMCVSLRNWMPVMTACDLRQPYFKKVVFDAVERYSDGQTQIPDLPINKLEGALASELHSFLVASDCALARSYCVQVYAKAVKFFVDNGRPPNTLQEINMSDRDPISGWQIKLRLNKNEMRVYNFGQDQEDNGGVTSEEARSPGDDTTPIDDVYIYHMR